ncbi:hypothetical protein HZ989_10110 [Brevundimonas sp. AJA228-03]|uniref:hypothetical protein n=1 Tax=Brevundimonas sp. AJA228-03 TaxID=2752515 RepID=UPI001ADFEE54|nr:hypothetical protein [Brevundimonas sp. AJA228-03]QTN18609.1 hypothetical protein HZ989_10110 [Brevundimonas sp. AJA228-03]
MPDPSTRPISWVRFALLAGIAFPILYFAMQIALFPFVPGYDFARDVASELGSLDSPVASVFNTLVMLIGAMAILAGVGQVVRMRGLGVNLPIALAAGLCVISVGGATLWAGLVPLPDPSHGASGPFMLAGVVYPAILLIVFRRSSVWRLAFLFALLAVAASAAVMTGQTGIDLIRWEGAIQRPVALALLGPVGLASFALWRGRVQPG